MSMLLDIRFMSGSSLAAQQTPQRRSRQHSKRNARSRRQRFPLLNDQTATHHFASAMPTTSIAKAEFNVRCMLR
ncbi:hypothetical protein [Pseudomonas sp. PS02288]|uniref:hypothetical protein n=1 Tax=Pseudomonas sp. PS02288 TaxID=2991443 RepID=UPI00249B8B76|nr:hypothetical protein [Pseudomonas sp. PS02288]